MTTAERTTAERIINKIIWGPDEAKWPPSYPAHEKNLVELYEMPAEDPEDHQ